VLYRSRLLQILTWRGGNTTHLVHCTKITPRQNGRSQTSSVMNGELACVKGTPMVQLLVGPLATRALGVSFPALAFAGIAQRELAPLLEGLEPF
jgi:hypothetical protein